MSNLGFFSIFRVLGKWKNLPNRLKTIFSKNNRWLRLLVVLTFAGYCFYFVYTNLYNLHWNEDKKREYIKTKEKEIVFDARKMESVLSKIEKRRERFNSPSVEVADIFKLNNYSE